MGKLAKKTMVQPKIKKPIAKTFKKSKPTTLTKLNKAKAMKMLKKQAKIKEDTPSDDEEILNEDNGFADDSDEIEEHSVDEDIQHENESESEDEDIQSEENESASEDEDVECNEEDEVQNDKDENIEDESDVDEDNDSASGDEVHDHQAALKRLGETDPEFYKFLQENDKKLLQFNVSDSDGSDEEKDADKVHTPGELEVASDESDFEEDAEEGKVKSDKHITLKMIKTWQQELQGTQKSNKIIIKVTKAFNAALQTISMDADGSSSYIVKGSAVFNGVVQLCVLYLGPALRSYLNLKKGQLAHKSKRFVKIKTVMKQYFTDLEALLSNVTSGNILNVLLKHLHYMTPILSSFSQCSKAIMKKLIGLWGRADEESVRVVSFLCVLRLVNLQRESLLEYVLKTMYMTYLKNAKFVSVNTLPSINFMRRSLVEIFALDATAAYQYVFLYIRQLAINLRNAIVDNKKENIHIVYNWQFVNSCKLWGNFLGQTTSKPQLQGLIYPFVQVCLGTLKLVPTAAYFPLRFHMVQILMDLSRDSGVFIPVLPFLTEVLTTFDFNKKHAKVSMKPLTFTTVLRMGKAQMTENGFKDTIIDTLYGCILEYLAAHSHSIAFPDMALFARCQIKVFLKQCSIAKYQRKMQQLLEKLDANVDFMQAERNKLSCALSESKKVEGFEAQIKSRGTPLSTFYDSWNKVRTLKRSKQATNNQELGEYNLPVLTKKLKREPKEHVDSDGKVVLFPSDSEDDDEAEETKRPKRGKRAGKNKKGGQSNFVPGKPVVDNDEGDLVEDIVDW